MEEDAGKRMRGRARGRGRGRARGRARGRTKKAVKIIESDEEDAPQPSEETPMETGEPAPEQQEVQRDQQQQQQQQKQQQLPLEQQFDLEADISQLEAPTFTTINRGPPEPMLRLRWDHRVNLIGEKVLNPMIHCCDKCLKPILIYGRMIPCKHVFCLSCAKREDKVCPRCMEKVSRVEQTGLGTVFMCTHGGTRYGNAGCRRTYLSQRDLQAHINHRHIAAPPPIVQGMQVDQSQYAHTKSDMESQLSKVGPVAMQTGRMKQIAAHMVQPIMGNDPRVNSLVNQSPSEHRQQQSQQQQQQQPQVQQHRAQQMMSIQNYAQSPSASAPSPSNNPPMRTNLITVPIQDTTLTSHDIHPQPSHHYYQPPPPQVNYGGYSVPPPVSQTSNYYAPSQHSPQVSYAPQPPQQQYVNAAPSAIRPSPNSYMQESPYRPPPQQQQPPPPPPPQTQWSQHQQQFYR